MNYNIISDKEYIVKLNYSHKIMKKELNDIIKFLLVSIRKKYSYDIYGFYEVDVYDIPNLIKVFHFNKKDEENYFRNNIDLKINKHETDFLLEIDDYILIKDYSNKNSYNTIKASKIKKEDIYRICEHYTFNLQ